MVGMKALLPERIYIANASLYFLSKMAFGKDNYDLESSSDSESLINSSVE